MGSLVLVVLLACGCTSPGASPSGAQHPSGGSTTTLPSPISLVGTAPTGSLSFLGPVMRVSFELPGGGATVTIGYRQFGSGHDLLLVPGEDATLSWWSPALLAALAASHRVTILDLPGSGFSGPGGGSRPSVSYYADVTDGLVTALGLSTPDVIGWGMGGEIALEMAVQHPHLIGSLVLADSSAGGSLAVAPSSQAVALLASPTATAAQLSSVVFAPGESQARSTWLREMALEAPDDMVEAAVDVQASVQKRFLAGGLAPSALAQLRTKVLIIEGIDDTLFPAGDASALSAKLHVAREMFIAGAGYGAIFALGPGQLASLEQFLSP
jgi:pimeloyl-ACP methyl ester carboxylesterase